MNDDLSPYEPANDDERRALERGWTENRLQAHVARIVEFVARHREEILARAGEGADAAALLLATKRSIMEAGTVHHRADMADQARAIRDEIWIRGEKGDYNREYIAHEWTSRHAANWRQWRRKEYFFVASRCADAIAAALAPAKAGEAAGTQSVTAA